jgi:hypothetical protein
MKENFILMIVHLMLMKLLIQNNFKNLNLLFKLPNQQLSHFVMIIQFTQESITCYLNNLTIIMLKNRLHSKLPKLMLIKQPTLQLIYLPQTIIVPPFLLIKIFYFISYRTET